MVDEKWQNSTGTDIAHYKYVYDGQGNIVRSIDILSKKEYNYEYEDGRIVRATEADIVLSAVDASRPVVTREMCAAVADRNVLFVDLGVPRNVDPFYDDWGHGVNVADLDDLKLWHRVKTGTLNEVLARADDVIRTEYRAML